MQIKNTLIVGWDGAEPSLVSSLIDSGRLPHLAALRARGLFGHLRSTVPDTSLAAWGAALCGVGPGKHGLVNFVRRQAGGYRLRLVNAEDRLAPTLFSPASRAGLRLACLGIPGTYPPEPLNGVCIAGFDSPVATRAAARAYRPEDLYAELRSRGLSWPYGGLDELSVGPAWHQRSRGVLLDNIRAKVRVAEAVLERGPFDLFWIVFSESDTAAHHFWAFADRASPRFRHAPRLADTLERVYQRLDMALGRLLDHVAERATVLVLSDHGSCGASDRVVYINRWLAEQGFLRFGRARAPVGRLAELARDLAARHLPAMAKQALLRSPLGGLIMSVDGMARFGSLDLKRSQAFSDELPQNPGIWIHLAGRDPLGMVPPGEAYERLRDRIADGLLRWREPHGQRPVVARVLRREDAFSGPAAERSPDLLLELASWNGYRLVAGASQGGGRPLVRRLTQSERIGSKGSGTSGAHAPNGMLVASGRYVRAQTRPIDARLVDICPTVMGLLGLEIPAGLDGRPIAEIVGQVELAARPRPPLAPRLATGSVYTAEEEAIVCQRLEKLGYL